MSMAKASRFYFEDGLTFDQKAVEKFFRPESVALMTEIKSRLEEARAFGKEDLEEVFAIFLAEKKIKLGDIAQPLRIALTGSSVSPGLFEVMGVLGKERVLSRIETAISFISPKEETKRDKARETSPI